jgi:DNA helicase II / ATP-dependent DNA helicase PcrA
MPKRGIGKVTLLKYISSGFSELPKAMQIKLTNFEALLDSIAAVATTKLLSETISYIITESGIEKHLLGGTDDDRERLENIRELVSLATKYDQLPPEEALGKFFEESTLVSDQDTANEEAQVKLMTVHASKGLEFENVFIVGLEHDLFPHKRIGSNKQTKEESEEERRLFYVALTRAKQKLFLSYVDVRTIYGSRQLQIPSPFLGDLGDVATEMIEPTRRDDFESDSIVYL